MSFSLVSYHLGRPIYALCDAVSRLQDIDQCGGVDGMAQLPMRIFRVVEKYYKNHDIPTPALSRTVVYLEGIKDMVTKFVNVPKSWEDLMKSMEKVPQTWPELRQILEKNKTYACIETLRGVANLTAATSKTLGIIDFLGKLGCEFSHLADSVGGSKLFCSVGSFGPKGIKHNLVYFTSTVRIVVHIMDCLVSLEVLKKKISRNEGEKKPLLSAEEAERIRKEEEHKKKYALHTCFFRCSIEISKMFYAYTAGSTQGVVLGVGVCLAAIQITGGLFHVYCFKGKSVEYPEWLKKPTNPDAPKE